MAEIAVGGKWKYMQFSRNYAVEVRDGVTVKGGRFFATIEPKHGGTVAVYLKTGGFIW